MTQPEPLRKITVSDASIIRNWWTSPFDAAYQSAHVSVHRHSVPAHRVGNHATDQPGRSHGARYGYGGSPFFGPRAPPFFGPRRRGGGALPPFTPPPVPLARGTSFTLCGPHPSPVPT